jgi:nucleotide-binding universal stress UspA family protein
MPGPIFLAMADCSDALAAVAAATAHFARLAGGEAHALHVRDALADHRSGHSAYAVGPAIEATLKAGEAKAAARADAARQAFAAAGGTHFIETDGDEAEKLAAHGRLADLLVVARPGADPAKPEPAYVGAAIFHSGRPVLVVPPQWRPSPISHAVVVWNDSLQATRALGAAAPLLHHAAKVTVASAAPKDVETTAPTAEAVAEYLVRRGATASAARFDPGSGSARARGRALLGWVAEQGGDLLVMGAYGEPGMLRFLGLGGATGKVITGCPVPVLMSH